MFHLAFFKVQISLKQDGTRRWIILNFEKGIKLTNLRIKKSTSASFSPFLGRLFL
jgi:hypothetical protein